MKFSQNDLAFELLAYNNIAVPKEIADLPHDYIISLMEPQLQQAADLDTLANPLLRKFMDNILSEMEDHELTIEQLLKISKTELAILSSLRLTPCCKLFAQMLAWTAGNYLRFPDVTRQKQWVRTETHWVGHKFWSKFSYEDVGEIKTLFEVLSATIAAADRTVVETKFEKENREKCFKILTEIRNEVGKVTPLFGELLETQVWRLSQGSFSWPY